MNKKEMKRQKMVGWYDPFQLARTGYEVFVSALFGKHADKRVIQAVLEAGSRTERLYHEIKEEQREEYWFDYVSDVGDGFNSTYTVAYHLTRPNLSVSCDKKNAKAYPTKCGELLVFGGDQVYPTAGTEAYQERLVFPYNSAFPKKTRAQIWKEPHPKSPPVFALPGNHDWYDSLAVFMNLFCRGRAFCGWKTYQNRSYFAVKLPYGWWIFGTDMGLSSSLDDPQTDYFRAIVRDHMKPGERIILCNAEPHWITDKLYRNDPGYNNRNMGFFEGNVLDHRVAIHVAGDRHYYRRHEEVSNNGNTVDPQSTSKIQKFVAGGGGAFLHPTHREGVKEVGRNHLYDLKATYPKESISFGLNFWNLGFPFWNLKFGLVTAALYLLTAQAFRVDLSIFGPADLWPAVTAVLLDILYEPMATFWVVIILLGFYLFTDTHSRYLRWIAGPAHAAAHLFAVFVLGWASTYWLAGFGVLAGSILSILILVIGGYVLGSVIFGIYLLISLNIFGIHHNEAFSAIKIEGYKNFLRLKIDRNGDLTIYPVGIEAAIKEWKDGIKTKGEPQIVPKASTLEKKFKPFLIEEPIVFSKPILDVTANKTESVSVVAPVQAPEDPVISIPVKI